MIREIIFVAIATNPNETFITGTVLCITNRAVIMVYVRFEP
jgi:hypothetical protein